MKVTLKELCRLLHEERRGLTELQQQFAKAKAAWETERAELKSHSTQVSPLSQAGTFACPQPGPRLSDVGAGCPSGASEGVGPPHFTLWSREGSRLA